MDDHRPEARAPEPAFALEPRRLGGDGCRKAALVGCGGLLVLLGIVAMVLMSKAPELFDRLMVEMEEQVQARLPADATEEERARLRAAFRDARSAVRRNEADPEALRGLQDELVRWTASPEQERLDRRRLLKLTAALEDVAGGGSADRDGDGANGD